MQSLNGRETTKQHSPSDRLPPQNVDAEEALLGSLLIDNDAVYEVSAFLRPEHFYRVINRWIYEGILYLNSHELPVDLITLTDELRNRGQLEEMGGEGTVIRLINTVPTSINAVHYGRIVEETAVRRAMIGVGSTIASLAFDVEGDLESQLIAADTALMRVRNGRTSDAPPRPREYASEWIDRINKLQSHEKKLLGLSSPWVDLNNKLSGFIPGKLYYIGARPAMGKSSMLIMLASHFTLDLGKRVYFWSGEMDTNQILDRIASERTRTPLTKIRTGDMDEREHGNALRVGGVVADSSLIIDETAGITPSQLRASCYREYMAGGLDAILVDYVGLMTPDRYLNNQNAEMTEISRGLLNLSRSLKVPVIAASQLSRDVEKRADKRPILPDLRDSGSLEQDGYAVMFLYRDDYYNELSKAANETEVIIAKHREGPTGTIKLYWESTQTALRNAYHRTIEL